MYVSTLNFLYMLNILLSKFTVNTVINIVLCVYTVCSWSYFLACLQDPRQLHLAVTRNQGTTGTISVDYYVTYLPEGVSNPSEGDPSVFAMSSGSVRLVGGQMVAEWDLEILNEAFLDAGAQFYVKLNGTYLVEGGISFAYTQNSNLIHTCT